MFGQVIKNVKVTKDNNLYLVNLSGIGFALNPDYISNETSSSGVTNLIFNKEKNRFEFIHYQWRVSTY